MSLQLTDARPQESGQRRLFCGKTAKAGISSWPRHLSEKTSSGSLTGRSCLAARSLARFWKEGKLQLGGKFCWPVHEVTGAVSKSIFVQRIEIVGIKGIL